MKDYGEEYPVPRIDTRELIIVTIITGIALITFVAVVFMPI